MEILQKIDRLKAELEALRPLDAEREGRIMQKFRLDWNYHSNHLEGNSLTYGETKALILFGITAQGKPLKDHLEMTGHNEAIKWIEEVIKEERPLTENFIRQLHELLLKEPYQVDAVTLDGKPTKKWIQIGQYKSLPNNVVTVTGETFYFATPEETPSMMTDLVDWYGAENEKGELHPLHLSALFHYRFVRIHPFDDGNGRTARILMNFILLQHGLPPVVIKTEDKENYFAALRQADAGLLEPFVGYIGENLVRSLDLMVRGAKGENVDEADDVDKRVKLIESSLKSLEESKKRRKLQIEERELLEFHERLEVIHRVVIPLFKFFVNEMKKIEPLYDKFTIQSYYQAKDEDKYEVIEGRLPKLKGGLSTLFPILYVSGDSFEIIEKGLEELVASEKVETLIIEGVFAKFKSVEVKIKEFDYKTGIEVNFYIDYYEIKVKNGPIEDVPKIAYTESFPEEADKIIKKIINQHLYFIESKIEEAQKSTSKL